MPLSGFHLLAATGCRTDPGLLNRNRRLAKDFEVSIASATTWIYIVSVQLLIRRLTCGPFFAGHIFT
jgi:hypothetical protein